MNKRIIARLEGQKAETLCGSEIAEILEYRLQATNCSEFMTPRLILRLIGMLTRELADRAICALPINHPGR